MKTAFHKLARATGVALISTTIAATTLIPLAAAEGSFSISVNAHNAQDRRVLSSALQLYSIVSVLKGGSGVIQQGENNNAGLRQQGLGNLGIVHQKGRGHQGSLQQIGTGNSHGLFQFGKNTNANVGQMGHGQTGATFVFGW
jgi:hypothetical protein